jgi:diaminopimelate epimerase
MARLEFAKYQGLGNHFVIVDLRRGEPSPTPNDPVAAERICEPHFGAGADGVLPILPPTVAGADARMRVLNADGSEAEMCGNGLRTVAKYLYDRDPSLRKPVLQIETGAGVLACAIAPGADGLADTVSVEMGRPRLTRGEIPMIDTGLTEPGGGAPDERCVEQPFEVKGQKLTFTGVSMGNPHAITFVSETGAALRTLAETLGPTMETHASFPRRTNVEFARMVSPEHIELVVWERGCGITFACGTGACATAVAACLTGRAPLGKEIRVQLLGGPLAITVAPDYSGVTMRGPARLVFEASIDLAALLARA